jgi:hypothetical protein
MIQILLRQTRVTILALMVRGLDTVLIEVTKTAQVSRTSAIQGSKMNQVAETNVIQLPNTESSFGNHRYPDFQNQRGTRDLAFND